MRILDRLRPFCLLVLLAPLVARAPMEAQSARSVAPAPVEPHAAVEPHALGFSANLRNDVEFAFAVRNLGPLVRSIFDSRTWSAFDALVRAKEGEGLEGVPAEVERVLAFVGSDVFVSLGTGAAAEIDRLVQVSLAWDRVSARVLAGELIGKQTGALGGLAELISAELYADHAVLLDELVALQLPRLLLGLRPAEGRSDALLESLLGFEKELPPFVTVGEVAVARAGTFRTWRMRVVDALPPEQNAELERELGAGLWADLCAVLESKVVEFAFGDVDGVLVASLGPDHAHLDFAQFDAEALTSVPVLRELGAEVPLERLLGFAYVSEPLADALQFPPQAQLWSRVLGAWVTGLGGFGGVGFGRAPELIERLGMLLDASADVEPSASASVVWVQDGLRGRSLGGAPLRGIDGAHPLRLTRAAPANALLAVHGASTPEGTRAALELLEVTGALGREVALGLGRLAAEPAEGEPTINELDELLSPLVRDAWQVLTTDLAAGLGHETALFIDLHGDLPRLPDLPAVLQTNGRGPRIALLQDVRERGRLSDAWTQLVPLVHEFALRLGELDSGAAFELTLPHSAGGDALRTHFFDLPIEHGGFLPALSLTQDALALGTSRRWNELLLRRLAEPGSAAELPRGFVLRLRLDAAHALASHWLELVRANLGPVFGEDIEGALEFKADYPEVRQLLDLFRGLRGLEYERHRDGRERSSWHFEVHDLPDSSR